MTGPDQNIRPPFQENYAEASTSSEPTEDTQINLMGLNGEQHFFLTQDDQEAHNLNKFQTKSGESFDFKEGYDAAVYEVHKQYKLRSITINVPEPSKSKDTKQLKRAKDTSPLTELPVEADLNPKEPIIEEISDMEPSNNQPSFSSFPKENLNRSAVVNSKVDAVPYNSPDKEKNMENTPKKEKSAVHKTRIQVEKPFNLETVIGKIKIAMPLSELAKHEAYREQINRSLQI